MTRTPLKLALLAGLGLSFAGAMYAPPAAARTQVAVGVRIGVAPPPPRFERVPPPRRGYVWAPGYWRWNASRPSSCVGRRHLGAGACPATITARRTGCMHGRDWRFQPGVWGR